MVKFPRHTPPLFPCLKSWTKSDKHGNEDAYFGKISKREKVLPKEKTVTHIFKSESQDAAWYGHGSIFRTKWSEYGN